MSIPEILQGDVHLPLTELMVTGEALTLANQFYQTDLNAEDFINSQAYKTPDGQLVLEVSDKTTGEVAIRFVNKAKANTVATPAMLSLWNPLVQPTEKHSWMAATVQLDSVEEVAFLDAMASGSIYPMDGDNTLAWKLATLLNENNVLGRWMAGSFAEFSTAGFELVFKGHSLDVPNEFLVAFSPMVVIIRIHQGNQKGYLCLKS